MGYTTEFKGAFALDRPLSPEHKSVLDKLADYEDDDYPPGCPDAYNQWEPTKDGAGIQWNGGEKFYKWEAWLRFIVDTYLKPWGYVLNGRVPWSGEDVTDTGTLIVEANVVTKVTRAEEAARITSLVDAVKWVLACHACADADSDHTGMCDDCRSLLKRTLPVSSEAPGDGERV
jgi:hypothetical protein